MRKYIVLALLIILLSVFINGCSKPQQLNLGKCLDIKLVASYRMGEPSVTQVTTERGFFVIEGYHSFYKGEDVVVCDYDIVK